MTPRKSPSPRKITPSKSHRTGALGRWVMTMMMMTMTLHTTAGWVGSRPRSASHGLSFGTPYPAFSSVWRTPGGIPPMAAQFIGPLYSHASPEDDQEHEAAAAPFNNQTAAAATPTVTVKRKKGGSRSADAPSSYRVLDQRDALPFAVQLKTPPDPYTRPASRTTSSASSRTPREGLMAASLYETKSTSPKKNNKKSKKSAARDDDDEKEDDPPQVLLGEFQLDKHTTTGDVLEIGPVQYKVIRHKCLYRYAGPQLKFVMVRKILEVQEIGRWQTEEYLQRQWQLSSSSSSPEASEGPAL